MVWRCNEEVHFVSNIDWDIKTITVVFLRFGQDKETGIRSYAKGTRMESLFFSDLIVFSQNSRIQWKITFKMNAEWFMT